MTVFALSAEAFTGLRKPLDAGAQKTALHQARQLVGDNGPCATRVMVGDHAKPLPAPAAAEATDIQVGRAGEDLLGQRIQKALK